MSRKSEFEPRWEQFLCPEMDLSGHRTFLRDRIYFREIGPSRPIHTGASRVLYIRQTSNRFQYGCIVREQRNGTFCSLAPFRLSGKNARIKLRKFFPVTVKFIRTEVHGGSRVSMSFQFWSKIQGVPVLSHMRGILYQT